MPRCSVASKGGSGIFHEESEKSSGAVAQRGRGAFDPSCAPWPSEPVGTKGVPPINRHPCGASNKGLPSGGRCHGSADKDRSGGHAWNVAVLPRRFVGLLLHWYGAPSAGRVAYESIMRGSSGNEGGEGGQQTGVHREFSTDYVLPRSMRGRGHCPRRRRILSWGIF